MTIGLFRKIAVTSIVPEQLRNNWIPYSNVVLNKQWSHKVSKSNIPVEYCYSLDKLFHGSTEGKKEKKNERKKLVR